MAVSTPLQCAIAAHRFGLGEADFGVVGSDAKAWLTAQIGPADAARGTGLLDTRQALSFVAGERARQRDLQLATAATNRAAASSATPTMAMSGEAVAAPPAATASAALTAQQALGAYYRDVIVADTRSRLATAAATKRPFAERLQLFWANHFTVSLAKGSTRGLIGAFERDAIRPHIAGDFETLLVASTTHPAMLRYLDNTQSAGPNSRAVAFEAKRAARREESPRVSGINENLAREVLELHTLGAEGARAGLYAQADVTAFAAVLSGWRVKQDGSDSEMPFDPAWHEPGTKTLLGKTYPEGPEALRMVLHDLAYHRGTARFVSTKLARHFVADEPPPAMVEAMVAAYMRSNGQLAEVYRALIASDLAWSAQPAKLKTPEEFVVSTARLLGGGERMFERAEVAAPGGGIGLLGQRVMAAPSPAGWSDRGEDWLGPDAVWKRVEYASRLAERSGKNIDARRLAVQSLGPLLGAETSRQLERASDGPQALALLLLAPEFQRR